MSAVILPFGRLWLLDIGFVTYAVRARDETAARLVLSVQHPNAKIEHVSKVRPAKRTEQRR